ncbi:MAG: CapA family protein [Lachnospiraceae bacterium]|nr:CapA family protein [Lachnospiraceae bacterium]
MKNKYKNVIFFSVVAAYTAFCAYGVIDFDGLSKGNQTSTKIESDSGKYVENASQKEEDELYEADFSDEDLSGMDRDVSDSIKSILRKGNSEFFGGYDIDAKFLNFVSEKYGKNVLNAISNQGIFDDPEVWFDSCGSSIHVLWSEYLKANGKKQQNVFKIKTDNPKRVTLAFSGDINLAEGMSTVKYVDSRPNGLSDGFSQELLTRMRGYDIFVINNEFCYSNIGEPLPGKAFTFRASPKRVSQLSKIGADVIGIANNHVFDYGEEAFLETLDTIRDAGYPYIGAGKDLSEAKKAVYYIACGRKISILAGTQIERSYTYTRAAGKNLPGVMKCLYPEDFCDAIREAKANSDFCLVFAHWGTEGTPFYGMDQVALATRFEQSGADVIIGGHTHCLQGIEFINDTPVYYSLGNYWFASTGNMPGPYDTGLCEVIITRGGKIKTSFLPCRFEKGVTEVAGSAGKERIISFLNEHSTGAVVDKFGKVMKKQEED